MFLGKEHEANAEEKHIGLTNTGEERMGKENKRVLGGLVRVQGGPELKLLCFLSSSSHSHSSSRLALTVEDAPFTHTARLAQTPAVPTQHILHAQRYTQSRIYYTMRKKVRVSLSRLNTPSKEIKSIWIFHFMRRDLHN